MDGLTNGDAPLMSPEGAAANPQPAAQPSAGASDIRALNEEIRKESEFVELLRLEMNKVIVGQDHMM